MLNKYFLYLLIGLICFSLEIPIKELPQFSQTTVYEQTYLYLNLDGFDKGSKVYIEFKFNNGYYYTEVPLGRYQSNTHNSGDFDYLAYYKSSSYSKSGTSYTFYFTIKLTKKTNYLLLGTPYFTDKPYTTLTVRHTKSSGMTKIIIIAVVIVVVVIIAIAIGVAFRYYRRRQVALLSSTIPQTNYAQQPLY